MELPGSALVKKAVDYKGGVPLIATAGLVIIFAGPKIARAAKKVWRRIRR